MREALLGTVVGLYVLWLLLVVVFVLGRYTPVPRFAVVRSSVVIGAAVLTVVGAGRLARTGYRRLAE
ncbi:hypothetical protein [Halopiger aswanensis]|uniref:Uncharacterized protein n=1 Tax=Halopiger aswanensis TaxID=148449 RepID=A0A3R7HWL1_9EURY|nr:hypothetical protein [Halopiger aswanensis]RKD93579.1 hypothetical protein ATJ93_3209 [Halopiger aswanensis]